MRLSACMIVKNEEELLPNCLNSLAGVINELCIVDTGSTDNTISLIDAFRVLNPKVDVLLKHTVWDETNFSKFRNLSIEMATGDYVLIIDADEVLNFTVPKDIFLKSLEDVFKEERFNAIAVTLRDWQKGQIMMSCGNARIFKPQIRYKGKIHNIAYYDKGDFGEKRGALLPGVFLDHYGYDLSQEKMDAKFKRTYEALLEQLDDPEFPHTEFYLCQSCGTKGLIDESLEWGEKYLNGQLPKNKLNVSIFYSLAKMYFEKEKYDRCSELVDEGFQYSVNDIDLFMLKSDLCAKNNNIFEASIYAKKYIETFRILAKTGLSGKFYFTFKEDAACVMFQRMAIGFLSEGLKSATAMLSSPHAPKEAVDQFEEQIKAWQLECIWDKLNEKINADRQQQASMAN